MTQPKDPQEFIVFKKDIGDGNGIAFKTHLATSELDVGFFNKNKEHLVWVISKDSYDFLQSKLAEAEAENKRFRDALHGLNNECAAMLAAHGDVILRDYGKTNLECLEFRLEKARAALKSEWK